MAKACLPIGSRVKTWIKRSMQAERSSVSMDSPPLASEKYLNTMTKVRFHLAKGPNYQRWQVREGDDVQYYDTEDVILELHGATLRNQRGTAERILAGSNKTVCAWVECEKCVVKPRGVHSVLDVEEFCHYNPRRRAHWFNTKNQNIDNNKYEYLATFGRLIIIPINKTG